MPTDKLSIEIESFRPQRSNTLFGFVTIVIPDMRLRIVDATVHEKNGARWIGLPAKPQITREGVARKDERTGKTAYSTVIEFTDKGTREAFSQRVIGALLARYPHTFSDEVTV